MLLCGLPGTGKSHLASLVSQRHPVIVVRSDEVRKALFAQPQYSTAESGIVYLTCHALLRQFLDDGHGVVFDATNLQRSGRKRVRDLAARAGAPVLTLLTIAPNEVVAARLAQRATGATETYSSDANWLVHQKLAGTIEQVDALALVVDTSQPLEGALAEIDRFFAALGGPDASEPEESK